MTTSFIHLLLTLYIITETSARRISNVSAAYTSIVKRNECNLAQEDDVLKDMTLVSIAQFLIFLKSSHFLEVDGSVVKTSTSVIEGVHIGPSQ